MHIQNNNNSFQRRDWRIRYLWKFPTWTIAQRVITSIATPTACPRISVIVGVLQESYRGLTGVLQDYTFQPEHLPSLCHLWHLQTTQRIFKRIVDILLFLLHIHVYYRNGYFKYIQQNIKMIYLFFIIWIFLLFKERFVF